MPEVTVSPERSERTIHDSLDLHRLITKHRSGEAEDEDTDAEQQRVYKIAAMGSLSLNGQKINRENIDAVAGVTQKISEQAGEL